MTVGTQLVMATTEMTGEAAPRGAEVGYGAAAVPFW